MDRTRDSSVVYQGMVRGFGVELIEQLNNISTQNTYPNITLLLDVPPQVGLKRRVEEGNEAHIRRAVDICGCAILMTPQDFAHLSVGQLVDALDLAKALSGSREDV